ncbi:MaoC family dehydratase N-terminal domain-containing protein [Streptomyces sp. KL116D]|uniref:FAS1-like dehydratase domain-containing protein n=1 Tax=Streptomyces sp. KL116D TaxID=3045152 RepID=UPI003558E208
MTIRFPIEAGHAITFVRAVGDESPEYLAELLEPGGTAPVPPTFPMAVAQFDPDSPVRPKPGQEWFGSGGGPGTAAEGGGALHAEQHFTYHRTPRVGDVLVVSEARPGKTWEKKGRSGVLRFNEEITEYRDQDGELVVTARAVGVQPQQPVTAAAEGASGERR